ncbi:hypothetical protein B296_00019267 [Ensete ventricosum]|uniref:beta-galactosidase n=1 Tax=Ensete ventricosum TaxID=4639 RepID=A0A426XU49_ENSVE|nr:hypothetical protein B296_00019267 [Ensete ventricosum]
MEPRPRTKRKIVVWLLTSFDRSSSPCITPARREVLQHPINCSEKRPREAMRMLAVVRGTLKETPLKLRPTGHHEPRAYDAWVRPRTVDAAATDGGVGGGGGVVAVAFLSGRCLRFLRPQGYHHQWAEEDSNLRFHSLSQEHPGGKKAKDGGLDVIQTYVFWNGHEPSPGQVRRSPDLSRSFRRRLLLFHTVCLNFFAFLDLWQYYFGGNYDLVRFIKLVKQAGLYVHLRIGPYVCAEWNLGYEVFD